MRQTRQQLTYLHTHTPTHLHTHTQTDDCVCCSKNNKWESHSCLPFQLKCAHICTGDTAKKWKKRNIYTISICIWHTLFNLCYNFLVLCAFWGVAKKLARRNGEPHTRTPICHGGWRMITIILSVCLIFSAPSWGVCVRECVCVCMTTFSFVKQQQTDALTLTRLTPPKCSLCSLFFSLHEII